MSWVMETRNRWFRRCP